MTSGSPFGGRLPGAGYEPTYPPPTHRVGGDRSVPGSRRATSFGSKA